MTDLVAVRHGNITRGTLTNEAKFFMSPLFPDLELHAAKKFTIETHKGHGDHIWNMPLQADGNHSPAITDDEGQEMNANVFNVNGRADDIACVRAEGFEVDDDNEALPENFPLANAPPVKVNADGLYRGQSWGWDGIDKQAVAGGGYEEPSFTNGWSPHNKTYIEIFTHLLPFAWLETVLLVPTSATLERNNSPSITLGELMRYIGMCLLMSTLQGWSIPPRTVATYDGSRFSSGTPTNMLTPF